MKLHIIATAYHRPTEIRRLVYDFLCQTNKQWSLRIIHDGPPPVDVRNFIMSLKDPRIELDYTKKINGFWGHPNRAMMLQDTQGDKEDYVLITNDDNQYVPMFIHKMFEHCGPKVGMVYCDCVHNGLDYNVLQSRIKVGWIDMGSFIVKLDLAKKVGFNHTVEVADGIYAEECAAECRKRGLMIVGIPRPLFIHN